MKRTGKFYRKNEAEIMAMLGLDSTPNSGSGWIVKEDGQNENIICQLKSTDANSIKVDKNDIDTLIYNAFVCHKLPIFAIQFLKSGELYLVLKPEDLSEIVKYINCGVVEKKEEIISNTIETKVKTKKINTSKNARQDFWKEKEENFKRGNKKWR